MLTLHHAPKCRSFRILWLLEELGQPYEIVMRDFRRGSLDESYRAIHPHKKVPALVHNGVAIFESSAICLYLADAFPEAGLGPKIGDPDRGPFLSWLAYSGGVIEPSVSARLMNWTYEPQHFAWGRFEDMVSTLRNGLSKGPYILGERFSAADVLIGYSVQIAGLATKLLPPEPPFTDYVARLTQRPAYLRAMAKDQG